MSSLPCRWEKQSIIVLDEVYIDPPYTVEACRANSKDSKGYSRVCKVVLLLVLRNRTNTGSSKVNDNDSMLHRTVVARIASVLWASMQHARMISVPYTLHFPLFSILRCLTHFYCQIHWM
ncbi:hypothetical protein PMAC_003043 [Pneumocystis sp. 'macacae']|nr:hypothetical protein PMAC_003043 [Pneumocystis sp. 'macacae']